MDSSQLCSGSVTQHCDPGDEQPEIDSTGNWVVVSIDMAEVVDEWQSVENEREEEVDAEPYLSDEWWNLYLSHGGEG
jgi:hypothetical protein